MDNQRCFEQNLLALSTKNPVLCTQLSRAPIHSNRYEFLASRSGETVPALVDSNGVAHPLHSLVDPRREGSRLISITKDEGFLIFWS